MGSIINVGIIMRNAITANQSLSSLRCLELEGGALWAGGSQEWLMYHCCRERVYRSVPGPVHVPVTCTPRNLITPSF